MRDARVDRPDTAKRAGARSHAVPRRRGAIGVTLLYSAGADLLARLGQIGGERGGRLGVLHPKAVASSYFIRTGSS